MILILITICVLFNKTIIAQDVSKIIGTYAIHEIRTSQLVPEYIETFDYEIKIEPSSIDSFDIQFFAPPVTVHDTVRGFLLNDSTFQIKTKWYIIDLGEDSLFESISGGGFFHGDSITINIFYSTLHNVPFLCSGKGIKNNGTGIIKQNFRDELIFYPNPAIDILYLDLPPSYSHPKELTVKVFNSTGILVLQSSVNSLNKASLDISLLEPGIYFIELRDNNQTVHSGKFIKK